MKVRNGFVSNSSSSSFVLVGFNVSGMDEEKFAGLHKKGFTYIDDEEYYNLESGQTIVGVVNSFDEGDKTSSINLDEIINKLEELRNIVGDKPIQLFYGTRYC